MELGFMDACELVLDQKTFSRLSRECEKIIDTRQRLPDFVFRRVFAKYYVVEYSSVYGNEFGAFLSKMSNILGEQSVKYMVLDPDPVDYYGKYESFFGLVSLDAADLSERYTAVMHPVRGISHILAGANIGVFWGSSLEWGIFCDRVSWEIAVIAVPENIHVPAISGFRCLDSSQLESYIKNEYHVKDPSDSIASSFSQRFLANYPI
jgi:hypothetical protein